MSNRRVRLRRKMRRAVRMRAAASAGRTSGTPAERRQGRAAAASGTGRTSAAPAEKADGQAASAAAASGGWNGKRTAPKENVQIIREEKVVDVLEIREDKQKQDLL